MQKIDQKSQNNVEKFVQTEQKYEKELFKFIENVSKIMEKG